MELKQNKSNKIVTSRNELIQTATNFYRELYKESKGVQTYNHQTNTEEVPPFIPSEIQAAINKLKTNKSPGEDNISNDIIKAFGEAVYVTLTDLYNQVLTKEHIPKTWKSCTITLLYKKGDPKNINNYRPISLLSTIYKIFTALISNRINKTIEENQTREQAGFRKNFSTMDHIFTLTQILERFTEYGKTIYIVFIDYKKAFDSIKHKELWKALHEQGIHNKYITILENIYDECTARVKLEKPGELFCIEKGVRQGDTISPKLFIALLEHVFRKLDWKSYGVNINGEYLSNLKFADDVVLISENVTHLQEMISSLNKESQKCGLRMNIEKTKVMTNGPTIPLRVNEQTLEYVDNYLYLGQNICFIDRTTKELDRRITLAWKKYWSLKEIFKGKFAISIKKKLADSTILPTLLYGCQTWALTADNKIKLRSFQRAIERSMMGLKLRDRIRSTKIRSKTRLTDAGKTAARLKWKWAGHVARTNDNRWSERVLHWWPREKRVRGRPVRRWRDDIATTAGNLWIREAQNRTNWQGMEEAYIQQWINPG